MSLLSSLYSLHSLFPLSATCLPLFTASLVTLCQAWNYISEAMMLMIKTLDSLLFD